MDMNPDTRLLLLLFNINFIFSNAKLNNKQVAKHVLKEDDASALNRYART
jgi:hypothetical protein